MHWLPTLLKSKTTTHIVVLLVSSAALLLPNLGKAVLFIDEAETLLIARNVIEYGVPLAYDGRNIVTLQNGADFNEHFLWTWHPWLQHYVGAFSILIFGDTPTGGRLLFTLTGIGVVVFFYFFSKSILHNNNLALLSSILLLSSLHFIIHMRFARYHSIATLATLGMLYGYFGILKKNIFAVLIFVGSATALFYSHYLTFAGIFAGCLLHYMLYCLLTEHAPQRHSYILVAFAGVIVLILPWVILMNPFQPLNILHVPHILNATFFIYQINFYTFPFLLIPFLLFALYKKHGNVRSFISHQNSTLVACIFLTGIVFSFSYYQPRYLIPLLPLCIVLLTQTLYWIYTKNKKVGYLVATLVLFTNILHVAPVTAVYQVLALKNIDAIFSDTKANKHFIANEVGLIANQSLLKNVRDRAVVAFPLWSYIQYQIQLLENDKLVEYKSALEYYTGVNLDEDIKHSIADEIALLHFFQDKDISNDTLQVPEGLRFPPMYYTRAQIVNYISAGNLKKIVSIPEHEVDWIVKIDQRNEIKNIITQCPSSYEHFTIRNIDEERTLTVYHKIADCNLP